MLFRRITAALLLVTCAYPASAFAEFCSGQYEFTTKMVNAAFVRYGTLYSGGDHWHDVDDVGATLDLYRLWRGLPDVAFRAPSSADYDYYSRPDPVENLAKRLSLVETLDGGGEKNVEERYEAAIELDLATRLAFPRDSWERSTEYPLFDWLNTIMVASDAPWTISAHFLDA